MDRAAKLKAFMVKVGREQQEAKSPKASQEAQFLLSCGGDA